jgi:hypothetical protein
LSLFFLLNFGGCAVDGDDKSPAAEGPTEIFDQGIQTSGPDAPPEQQVVLSQVPATITAVHAPLYNPEPHTSVITARVSNMIGGLAKITIYAIKGTITDCTELGVSPRLIPCRKDATPLPISECEFEVPLKSEDCVLTVEVEDGDMISYFAVATPVSGSELETSMITYAGGQPDVAVAVPVWWHTDTPSAPLTDEQINLAIYIDPDFGGDLEEYGYYLSAIVDLSYFTEGQQFAENYTRNRQYFNIWAFPFAGASTTPNTCVRQFLNGAALLDSQMDGSAILHKTNFTDCSSIGTGGTGSVGAYEAKPDWLLVHESGHFLFGLADEYGDGGQVPESEPLNVFSTLPDCETAAPLVGASKFNCKKFGWVTETYRIQTDEPETMREQLYTSDFYDSSDVAVSNRFSKCASGDCYGTP